MRRSWVTSAAVALSVVVRSTFAADADPQWKMAAPLPKAIGEIEAASVNGKIYVLSGLDNRPGVVTPTGYNWMYDPAADAWTDRKPMPVPAHHIMVATWNDKIYVFGGFVRPRPSSPGNRSMPPGNMTRRPTPGGNSRRCRRRAVPARRWRSTARST